MSLLLAYTYPFALSMAGFLDLLTMKIPNKLVLFFLGAFFVAAAFSGMTWQEFQLHLAAGALALLITFVLFIPGWIGGGDAKFFAVAALWVGWEHLLIFGAGTTVFGGILAMGFLLFRTGPLPQPLVKVVLNTSWLNRLHNDGEGIPYGIAIAITGVLLFPDTRWAPMAGLPAL